MGIRDHPIAPRSPWQNGYAERLVGSIRQEMSQRDAFTTAEILTSGVVGILTLGIGNGRALAGVRSDSDAVPLRVAVTY